MGCPCWHLYASPLGRQCHRAVILGLAKRAQEWQYSQTACFHPSIHPPYNVVRQTLLRDGLFENCDDNRLTHMVRHRALRYRAAPYHGNPQRKMGHICVDYPGVKDTIPRVDPARALYHLPSYLQRSCYLERREAKRGKKKREKQPGLHEPRFRGKLAILGDRTLSWLRARGVRYQIRVPLGVVDT
jgi:hypothetical protein